MMTDPDPTPPGVAAPRVDRAAALAEGAPKVPRRVVMIALAVAAVLAIGGTGLERLFSSAGLNPVPATAPVATLPPVPLHEIRASMAAFLGIVRLSPTAAPPVALIDQNGTPVSISQLRGKVVVISFFNADCADACPVIAADIRAADSDLGVDRSRVVFLTVNTDPLQTATEPRPAAVTATGLATLGNWYFVTGSLRALNTVWRQYGVSINVYAHARTVTHNNVMYFVDPQGRLRLRATPVADEDRAGRFSLPMSSVSRSGAGIASYSTGLFPSSP